MLRRAAFILPLAVTLTLPPTIVQAAPRFAPVAHGGAFGGHGGGRAMPRFGPQARFGRRVFRPFPFRHLHRFPHRFRPFVGFGFAFPLYAPDYPYNPYCDPASVYYYPPWCY
jgi:hypothetical protein